MAKFLDYPQDLGQFLEKHIFEIPFPFFMHSTQNATHHSCIGLANKISETYFKSSWHKTIPPLQVRYLEGGRSIFIFFNLN